MNMNRRAVLHAAGLLAGTAVLRYAAPGLRGEGQTPAPQGDPLAQMRRQLGAAAIASEKLAPAVTMLSGAGGNVILIHGKDGKVLVDGFVKTAWGNLKKTLEAVDSSPIKVLIDTHWHFDHADKRRGAGRRGHGDRVREHAGPAHADP